MLNKVDKGITLRRLEQPNCSERTVKRLVRSIAIVLGSALCFSVGSAQTATTAPTKEIKRLTSKEYAKGQLTNHLYKCLSVLYGKESGWNYKSIGNLTGKHKVYGIPQGKSEWLKDANPLEQIDWGLRYISHRYGVVRTIEGMQPDTCKALQHWKIHGWH